MLVLWCQMLSQPLAWGRKRIPHLKRGWEDELYLIRVFTLYSPFHPVITSQAILAIIGCPRLGSKENPISLHPWKLNGKLTSSTSVLCPKFHVQLITTCDMSKLKFYVTHNWIASDLRNWKLTTSPFADFCHVKEKWGSEDLFTYKSLMNLNISLKVFYRT